MTPLQAATQTKKRLLAKILKTENKLARLQIQKEEAINKEKQLIEERKARKDAERKTRKKISKRKQVPESSDDEEPPEDRENDPSDNQQDTRDEVVSLEVKLKNYVRGGDSSENDVEMESISD